MLIDQLSQRFVLFQKRVAELNQGPPSLSVVVENDECSHECLCEPCVCASALWRSSSKEFETEANVNDWAFGIVTIVSEKILVNEETLSESECRCGRRAQILNDESESEQWSDVVNLLESPEVSGCRRTCSLTHLVDVAREDHQRMRFLRPRLETGVLWQIERC